MDLQEVKWEHYPQVAAHPAAHSFVERLVLKGKRPKTVDAYARSVELDFIHRLDKKGKAE